MIYSLSFFGILRVIDGIIWEYVAFFLIMTVGLFFTWRSKFFQFKCLARFKRNVLDLKHCSDLQDIGTNPFKLYFASIGGMIGLGNIVVIVTTVTSGGPGSVLWMWIMSFIGMLIKYSEIYLGIKYRIRNNEGGYDGGPMYYLMAAFSYRPLCIFVCLLLCVYGAEVSQFLIITDTLVGTFGVDRYVAIGLLLAATMVSAVGGVGRVANICSIVMPVFVISYVIIGVMIIADHADVIPSTMALIWHSAWNGHAPVAGFAGGTMLQAARYGIARAVYSGDIGIGYDSIVQSETRTLHPHKQARMGIYALFTDLIICTISVMIVLLSGIWKEAMQPSQYVATVIAQYIPFAQYFMASLFFLAGFTTIIGYLVVGQKCAKFINKKYGAPLYLLYASMAFIAFSFHAQENAILIMSCSGGALVIINIIGLVKLRKDIKFI